MIVNIIAVAISILALAVSIVHMALLAQYMVQEEIEKLKGD